MNISAKTIPAEKIYPVAAVTDDGIVVSVRGALTLGWELTFPTAYPIGEKDYDEIIQSFNSAVRVLPEWAVVHRQDVYMFDTYRSARTAQSEYLAGCFEDHFDGRRYLTHRAYVYLTFSSKGLVDKKGKYSGIVQGVGGSSRMPEDKFQAFLSKGKEFITIITRCSSLVKARPLTRTDWIGEPGGDVGMIQKYMMLGDGSLNMSDISLSPDEVCVGDKVAFSFCIGESDYLPNEVPSVIKTNAETDFDIVLSYASKIGILFNHEHIVNQYIIVPPQQELLKNLDKEKNKMNSGSTDADNRINAEEIQTYQDDAYRNDLLTVKSHLNVIVWGTRSQKDDLVAELRAAFMSMNITTSYNLHNTPILYYAGIPSNSFEIGTENLMTNALLPILCLNSYETFEAGMEGGFLKMCDRVRNIPISLDTQVLARNMGLVDNYNAFILGPSGTGKSYFMNNYLKWCYNNGESVFLIDVGGSYEAVCHILNEETGGRDGHYFSWNMEDPPSFNPFIGYKDWLIEDGLRQDENGANAFMSFMQTIYTPRDGWTNDNIPIIRKIMSDFLIDCRNRGIDLPILNEFNEYVSTEVLKRILYRRPERSDIRAEMTIQRINEARRQAENHFISPEEEAKIRYDVEEYILSHSEEVDNEIQSRVERYGYCLSRGRNQITPEIFDIEAFLRAMSSYVDDGVFSFFLNDRNPKDIFVSKYVCFDVETLSKISDPKFYSLVILFIMNEFDRKMRSSTDFKVIVIEEAWKAIANETMAPFLVSLWKTARKFQTSAIVVTQEMQDILSSAVIKDTIMANSSVKVLLDQKSNNRFDETVEMMGLSERQVNLVKSIKTGANRYNPNIRQSFIAIGNSYCGVYDGETSAAEVKAFESDKVKKRPTFDLAERIGWIGALEEK